ncbi:barstar family protein [Thermoactinomyces sp. DSM 45891]|uniref:barstar family protein n=1 Tax=Thermoactinomyces sp. DSM 45891 TaxID=1761907 RepID=UPI0009313B44|nr:barstar family protein [Thermoactinomyces sp. DSM 45891]
MKINSLVDLLGSPDLKNQNLVLITKKSKDIKEELDDAVKLALSNQFYFLDGDRIRSEDEFYVELIQKMPYINGFGNNVDAVIDLIRTLSYGVNSKRQHQIFWYHPQCLLSNHPVFYTEVVDALLGTLREISCGSDIEMEESPEEFWDWEPTKARCILFGNEQLLNEKYDYTRLHSPFWDKLFHDRSSNTKVIRLD